MVPAQAELVRREKLPHEARDFIRPLEVRQVTSVVDNRDLRTGDPLCEFVGVGGRDHRVRLAPDDQGWCGDTVDRLLRPLSGIGQTNFPV